MQILLLIIASTFSGIFAGMGMGGGTFLIPILSLFFGVSQLICQSTNVVCFLVLAIVCFVVYAKNKLIDYKVVLCVVFPSVILSTVASIFAIKVSSNILQICFSCFIILIGIFYFIKAVLNIKKEKEKEEFENRKYLKVK
ncbi:MAG: sulfite exporter TauE/SafE family protein [Clostridia bacterium]|nr:sulfite exporter TauE/SafE family protein [Clostridia bacterium]